ncbi:MAG: GNAT family N-acetyltransferase [Azonexus sp.]|jgi:ribosomal protein S18 acetylase RimI-like enzyme|uniref:GNAT family N-acetyltransferase n=1 Tax=Azonexus sp. TaxID=1872668 RepID=UPI002827CF69|nr:GNAT family N-acetyltransferase [Azonexus sp.]MDR0777334.1 GNAT family N-acetyltransferase [Azonexus sp.]
MSLEFRVADRADAGQIAALVNSAYRPTTQDAGWTHEAHLVAGDRITAEQVLSLFDQQSAILLLCAAAKIVACVHVQGDQPGTAYIGMLATDPKRQAQGLGKQMLRHAEAYATAHFAAMTLNMTVLSSRPELLAFYERRGYALTGEIKEYPLSAEIGRPLAPDIHLLALVKTPPKTLASGL